MQDRARVFAITFSGLGPFSTHTRKIKIVHFICELKKFDGNKASYLRRYWQIYGERRDYLSATMSATPYSNHFSFKIYILWMDLCKPSLVALSLVSRASISAFFRVVSARRVDSSRSVFCAHKLEWVSENTQAPIQFWRECELWTVQQVSDTGNRWGR